MRFDCIIFSNVWHSESDGEVNSVCESESEGEREGERVSESERERERAREVGREREKQRWQSDELGKTAMLRACVGEVDEDYYRGG